MPKVAAVINTDAINAALDKLVAKVQRSIYGKALRAGARLTRDVAKQLVPVLTGKLQSHIDVKTGRSKSKGRIVITLGSGKKTFGGGFYYGSFQELGWKSGKRGTSGRKKQPGEHFLENAFEETKEIAVATIETKLAEGVEKAVKELEVKGEAK